MHGELPASRTRFFANGYDRALTGGRQCSTDDPGHDVLYSGGGSVRLGPKQQAEPAAAGNPAGCGAVPNTC